MADPASTYLTPWASYYVMVGSGSAALVGLMFVVITLITDIEEVRKRPDGISTFSTPTVSHFSVTLFISAVMVAPWRLLIHPAIALLITGLYGTVYGVLIIVRMRGPATNYEPDLDDLIWYGILPLIAYLVILASSVLLTSSPLTALFGVAAAAIGLMFLGIRNSWDVVTFLALRFTRTSTRE